MLADIAGLPPSAVSAYPAFTRVVSFAGKPDMETFKFVKGWNYDMVELRVTARKAEWTKGKHIGFSR